MTTGYLSFEIEYDGTKQAYDSIIKELSDALAVADGVSKWGLMMDSEGNGPVMGFQVTFEDDQAK